MAQGGRVGRAGKTSAFCPPTQPCRKLVVFVSWGGRCGEPTSSLALRRGSLTPVSKKKNRKQHCWSQRTQAREHKGVTLTGLQAQFFRGLGRGVCVGCGHLRRFCDLQCSRCRVTTPACETREGDVVTAASSGGRNGDARDVSDLLENVAGAREGVRGDLRGGHHVRASADGVSDVGLVVGRQRRRVCPALPHDFVGRCEALGSATLVHVPNPAREELCAIVCDGLEGMLDGYDNWSKIAQCTLWLLLGAVPKGDNPTSELRTRLRLWRTDFLEELLTRREQQRRGIVESRYSKVCPRLRSHSISKTSPRARSSPSRFVRVVVSQTRMSRRWCRKPKFLLRCVASSGGQWRATRS